MTSENSESPSTLSDHNPAVSFNQEGIFSIAGSWTGSFAGNESLELELLEPDFFSVPLTITVREIGSARWFSLLPKGE